MGLIGVVAATALLLLGAAATTTVVLQTVRDRVTLSEWATYNQVFESWLDDVEHQSYSELVSSDFVGPQPCETFVLDNNRPHSCVERDNISVVGVWDITPATVGGVSGWNRVAVSDLVNVSVSGVLSNGKPFTRQRVVNAPSPFWKPGHVPLVVTVAGNPAGFDTPVLLVDANNPDPIVDMGVVDPNSGRVVLYAPEGSCQMLMSCGITLAPGAIGNPNNTWAFSEGYTTELLSVTMVADRVANIEIQLEPIGEFLGETSGFDIDVSKEVLLQSSTADVTVSAPLPHWLEPEQPAPDHEPEPEADPEAEPSPPVVVSRSFAPQFFDMAGNPVGGFQAVGGGCIIEVTSLDDTCTFELQVGPNTAPGFYEMVFVSGAEHHRESLEVIGAAQQVHGNHVAVPQNSSVEVKMVVFDGSDSPVANSPIYLCIPTGGLSFSTQTPVSDDDGVLVLDVVADRYSVGGSHAIPIFFGVDVSSETCGSNPTHSEPDTWLHIDVELVADRIVTVAEKTMQPMVLNAIPLQVVSPENLDLNIVGEGVAGISVTAHIASGDPNIKVSPLMTTNRDGFATLYLYAPTSLSKETTLTVASEGLGSVQVVLTGE